MASQPASRKADRLTADIPDPGICPAVPGGCLRDALLPLRPDATLTLDPASRLVDGTVYGARGRTGESIATAPHTAQHRPTHPVCAVTTGRHCAWEAQLLPESGHLRLPYWTIQRSQQPPAVYRRSGELCHGQEEHAVGPVRSHDTRDPIPPKSFSGGGVRSAPRTHLLPPGPWAGANASPKAGSVGWRMSNAASQEVAAQALGRHLDGLSHAHRHSTNTNAYPGSGTGGGVQTRLSTVPGPNAASGPFLG